MSAGQDDFAARAQRVSQALEQAPKTTLDVLVEALGASLGRSRGETDWTLSVACDAWKPGGGELRRSRLILRCRGTVDALRPWQSFLAGGTCVRVQARLLEDNELEIPQAWLVKRRGSSDDAELAAIRDELAKPVVVDDPQFGSLTLDRALDWYAGSIDWLGQEVRLTVTPEAVDEPQAAVQVARALAKDAEAWQARVRDYAVQKLLGLKNESWLGDDEPPVDAETFLSRMTLTTISVSEGGSWSFWHEDGGLFAGHSILVSGDLESGPTDADIPG